MTTDHRTEPAAIALYEHTREPEYAEPYWDWPNIDKAYDWDDDDDDRPAEGSEWLRDRIRSEVGLVLAAGDTADREQHIARVCLDDALVTTLSEVLRKAAFEGGVRHQSEAIVAALREHAL